MTFERILHDSHAQFRHTAQQFDEMSQRTGDYHGRCLNRIDYAANDSTRHPAGGIKDRWEPQATIAINGFRYAFGMAAPLMIVSP